MTMTVNIVRQQLIKPSKPTPPHLRTYNISLVDELNPSVHIIRILFFPHSDHHQHPKLTNKYSSLEHSLAQVLPLFYPLAGRYNNQTHKVDCNDEGAEFSIARVFGRQLHHLIGAESEHLNHLLPIDVCAADEPTDPMLAVRINEFPCGGLAIGVCASHRIFDNPSLAVFLSAWARAASGEDVAVRNYFDSSSNIHFPSENMAPVQFEVSRTRDKSIVSKRFVFSKHAISGLREHVTSCDEWKRTSERPPSRVVLVSAVLTQALLRADRARNGGTKKLSRPTLLTQWVDVRGRTVPPVARHTCGTWVAFATLEMDAEETDVMEKDFAGLAVKMRELTVGGVKDCERILSDKKFGRWALVDSCIDACERDERGECKVVWLTDLSKAGDYELDFGFGKPVWVSLADVPFKNVCMLMNTKDNDGIEAWVFLDESEMPFFQQDRDLQSLTTTTSDACNV